MKNARVEANSPHIIIDKEAAQKKLRTQALRDSEMVRGRFKFHEVPGGSVSFCFKVYNNEDVKKYTFIDGQIYTIPLGVARHLNKNCWYPEYGYMPVQQGEQPSFGGSYNDQTGMNLRVSRQIQRMGFESLEFMDVDDVAPMSSPIITVSTV